MASYAFDEFGNMIGGESSDEEPEQPPPAEEEELSVAPMETLVRVSSAGLES